MSTRVVRLGVNGGPSIRPVSAMPTASLVELGGRRVVVDCGLGVARGMTRQGVEPASLDLILVTNLHSDRNMESVP